jgi:trimethylamine--corrinoid protein Co-methyltransferase
MAAQGLIRTFKPLEILSEEQIQAIHGGALDVLEVTGVAFESPRALDILARAGARIDLDNQRARIPAGLAVASCRQCPSSFHMQARDPRQNLHIGGNATYFSLFSGMRIVDLETWEARTPTVEENIDACKVADQLEHVHAATSYTPYCEFTDVPPAMLLPVSCWCRMKYFSKISRVGAALDSHIFEIEMAQALGVDVYGAMECSPPLTFSADAIECAIACAEKGYPVEPGCGGVMGATHPASIAGALVVAMAECIAGITLVQAVRPGTKVIVNSFDIPQNMRSGSPAFGAVGISLFQVAWNQIWRQMYSVPTMNGGVGPSASKAIDYQCGYERTLGITLSVLSGAHVINTVGGLTGELSYHPALSVLDDDLIGMLERFVRGVQVDHDALAVDLIENTGPIPGFYLNTAHTRKWWKGEGFIPLAADLLTYGEWLEGERRVSLQIAEERADKLIKNYQPSLPAEQDVELDRILEDARRHYQAKGLI